MKSKRRRALSSMARGALLLGACAWCCSLYEGRTLEFFADPESTGTECQVSSQCSRERAFCAGGACRECLVDGDCGRGKPACVGNVCVECRSAGDCPSGQSCNPWLSTCAFVCSGPSECAGQPASLCSSELDLCVQCLGDEDCREARNPACDVGGRCVECRSDLHCPPDRPSCDPASRRCEQCIDSSQCDGRVCDPRDHRCVDCLSDADCPAGSCEIERRRCLQPCGSDADCDPQRPVCDAASGSCVECNTREECRDPRRPACTLEHECVECLTDSDCTQPDKPACLAPSRRCGQCALDSHCGDGQHCELAAARCVPTPEPAPDEPDPIEPAPGAAPGRLPGPGRADAGAPPPAPGP